jgi:signal transduction histidine kinase
MDPSTPLLDRTNELSRLDRAWEKARSRQPVFVFVSGGAGVGKTTLVNGWVGQCRPTVHLKIDFSGNYGATTSALVEAFQTIMERLAGDSPRWKSDLVLSLGRDGSGIREVFPGFPGNSWFTPSAVLLDGEQLSRRFLHLLKSLLDAWSRCYGTILLTVENWHLADGNIQHLVLNCFQAHLALLCIATSRQAGGAENVPKEWSMTEIALAPFPQAEVRRWIARLFKSETNQRLAFLSDLCEHANGNPLHLKEILSVASEPHGSEVVAVPIDAWFDRKIRDLDPETRSFLEAGAILGSAFLASTALECAGLNRNAGLMVAEGIQRMLLARSGAVCTWVHDLIREAVLRSIDAKLRALVSWKAAIHILWREEPTTEQILMFPGYLRAGHGAAPVTAETRLKAEQLLWKSAVMMRRRLNHSGASDALSLLRSLAEEQGLRVSDETWEVSAEIAFERGDVIEAIAFLGKMSRISSPVLRIKKDLILCRSFYVTRDLAGILRRMSSFSRVLWPARILAFFGSSVTGFASTILLPLLLARMRRAAPRRMSHRRELNDHLYIALVFFAFQHDYRLSAALGVVFAARSMIMTPSFNMPMAGVVIGMFGNLPRFAARLSSILAQVSRAKQSDFGNPSWKDRFDFLYNLFYVHQISGVSAAMTALQQMILPGRQILDPEVEILVKFNVIALYFWADMSMGILQQEILASADAAMASGNFGLESVFRSFGNLVKNAFEGDEKPWFLYKDPMQEQRLFNAWEDAKEFFVASGLRFRQAFFALLVGHRDDALSHVRLADPLPHDTSYWVPRIFDSYTACIAGLAGRKTTTIKVPYAILKATVRRNPREFQPYLTHVDAERARKEGMRDSALRLYQEARADFQRLQRPVLAALVDWRTGDLFWEEGDREIAQAYFGRAQKGFADCGMNSSVNAIHSQYALEAPHSSGKERVGQEYMTAAMGLHRLTVLGKLAAETAREIKSLNNNVRASCEVIQKGLTSLGAEADISSAAGHIEPTLRSIQESVARIDAYLRQFRMTDQEPVVPTPQRIDLGGVIRSTVEAMSPVIGRFTRNFHLEPAPPDASILGQAEQIDQVVMNLILNACESLPGVDRRVSLAWTSGGDDHFVSFRVTDEGRGIPSDILPRVTEPFFTTKGEQGGTGLGLALCARIVEAHGGSLRIESETGVGTTVTVAFPRA